MKLKPITRFARNGVDVDKLTFHLSALQQAFDKAPFLVWARDRTGRLVFQNAESVRLCGDQIGKTPETSGVPPAFITAWKAANRRALTGHTVREETELDVKGRKRWFQSIVTPFRVGPRIVGVVGFLIDIDEQKSAKKQLEKRIDERTAALSESEGRLTRVMEGSYDGYWERELPSGRVFLSGRCRQILGVGDSDEYIAGEAVVRSIHPDDLKKLSEAVQRCIRRGSKFDHYDTEYRHVRPDGRIVWVHTRGTVTCRNFRGEATKVSGMITDITDRKQADDELRQRSRQLAQLASELTVTEHRERRRLAEVLHDHLQQLLVAARMQVLSLENDDEKCDPQIMVRLRHTLDEALASSRSITRDLAPPVSLRKNLSVAMRWLAREMHSRYQLEVLVKDGHVEAPVSEAAIVLLFTAARELLMNVVKHSGCCKATLNLKLEPSAIVLVVSDKGKGIQPEILKDPGGRKGFGLFSIRERTELLGGKLSLATAPGRGMRVTLSLPLPPPGPGSVPAPAGSGKITRYRKPGRAARSPARVSGQPIRVVFADDHRTVREGMVSLLRSRNDFTIVGEADNGEQAVECVRRFQPDVVIMDVSMPVMDGVAATRIIRKRWPKVRIIGLSMFDDAVVARQMRDAGASDYITKSAAPENLIKAIRDAASDCTPA